MADDIVSDESELDKVLRGGVSGDFLRELVRRVVHEFMEAELTTKVGAERYERTASRTAQRNGYRERGWETRVGTVDLAIPRLRQGSYFPSFLEPRRRSERALVSVVKEAYLSGVSTRRVDDLVKALGVTGMDKSAVSRMCKELNEEAEAFRNRSLEGCYPYIWVDALYEKVREGGHVRSMAVAIVIGVTAKGHREVLGIEVGHSEDEAFWKSFLRSLVKRGLAGVQLVISDAHVGLKKAVAEVLTGAVWQRCRVHFMRNIAAVVPRDQQPMLLAAVKTIFAQPTREEARRQLREVAAALRARCPKAAERLEEAEDDVLAYMSFPVEHRRQIHSTNPLERQNKEIRRRTRVIGIFPSRDALLRIVSMLLVEQHDEWQAAERAYFSAASMAKVNVVTTPPRRALPSGRRARRRVRSA